MSLLERCTERGAFVTGHGGQGSPADPGLFDRVREARDAAIATVTAGADDEWMSAALDAIRDLSASGAPFTADDVWARLDALNLPEPREPRAMGGAFKTAVKMGLCRATEEWRVGVRVVSHGRPVRVWGRA